MAWVMVSDNDAPIIDEIETQTDRGAALIAAAYLEERLLAAIKARTNRNDKIEVNFYRHSGPLGSFSAKIELGFLLGIYGKRLHRFLHTIREIRNEFAHIAKPRDFNSQRIRDLTNNLQMGDEISVKNKEAGIEMEFTFNHGPNSRETFMAGVKLILLCLHMELKHLPPRVPAPPVIPIP